MTTISRAEYAKNSTELHAAYFSQFVTPAVKERVLLCFSRNELREAIASDKHINNLPIAAWDAISRSLWTIPGFGATVKAAGDSCTLSVGVCIAKAAARMIVA